MRHVLHYFAQAAALPLSLETAGDPRSANSAAPQGCVGQGMGSMPMSPCVPLVPFENAPALCATAQGIVTRMGQDPQGLGGEAIEPGPAGMRPALSFAAAAGACACAGAAPLSVKRSAAEGAAPAIYTPPSNTGVNKIGSGHGV